MTAVPEVVGEAGLAPGSPEWVRRVSPSKVAGMLGLSPWDSPYAMWRKMRGDIPWDSETEAMERGTLCEPAVLAWWRKHHEHHDWEDQATMTLGDWCVATPDGLTVHDGEHIIVEAKTSARMEHWGEPGTDQIPLYYLTQVYVAMEVARRNGIDVTAAHVPVLGGYRLAFANYVVPYSPEWGADLLARCREFYDSLTADVPPPLDDTVATYEAVRRVHPDIERGTEVELDFDDAVLLVQAQAEFKEIETRLRFAKSRVIDLMGRSQFAKHDGVKIARRQPRGEDVSFVVLAKPSDLSEKDTAV